MLPAHVFRVVFIGSILASMASMASAPNSTHGTKLACPEGTVQKGRSESIFCVKKISSHREPELHGPYMDLYANGQKKAEGQYVNGFRSGRWMFWEANGIKSGETNFSEGNYDGERTQYFANGKPQMIEQYKNGKRHGSVQEFAEDGKLIRQTQYRDDRQLVSK